jgi:uncharacterized protein
MQQEIIETKNWIEKVVIGCNFCPFASKVFIENSIHYIVVNDMHSDCYKATLINVCKYLDKHAHISTAFVIFSKAYQSFNSYLSMLSKAKRILGKYKYEGVYQIASFHPEYIFQDTTTDDATNFTNRSPYAMLHILREKDITNAIKHYGNSNNIPENNKKFINNNGIVFMQRLLDSCRL